MAKAFALVLAWALGGWWVPAWAEEDLRALVEGLRTQMSELKRQAEQSNARIADLEKQLAQAKHQAPANPATVPALVAPVAATAQTPPPAKPDSPKPPVTVGDAKGTFKVPGTDTSIGIGGFIKLDAIYNSVSDGTNKLGNQLLVPSQIPSGSARANKNSQFLFNPKETRLWVKSFTPSAWGDINTFLEVDFYGSADTYTYTPRLRHAYGTLGHFLAGQTWTTFLNVQVIPDTLDLGGPVGSIFYLRQPMLRWTQPFTLAGTPLNLQIAAESPRSRLWEAPQNQAAADGYGFVQPDDDRYPDMIARLNFVPAWGNFSLSAMARQIRSASLPGGHVQQAWGGAVSLAGKVQTYDLDNLRFMLNYGDALGRYASINTFEDAAVDATGQLRLVAVYSGMAAYQHWWNPAWRTNVAYGFEQAEQPVFVAGSMTRQAQSVHVNLLWSPTLQTTLGLEYIYATRNLIDGQNGDLSRVQFSTRFDF
ncbi:DcaP family trimeric outer membrane transporter [Methylomagnum ishizawai]|uniref:DcaP family trimeric outer membrane transporter n=1 Tax=Methylomagnum ishizawai TaxID=1760988 RepID=UPI001C31FE4B|nr:DcaP family trimeric outer membrane transporter [Methylomagnum ishizawai]BBL77121.1 hypothetical protein MishRS11D_42190 [Methylomagnum ishizawai]